MSRGTPVLLWEEPLCPSHLPTITHVVFQGLWGRPLDGQQSGICTLRIDPGQAKIAHFGHVLLRDEDVAGSQVPVHQLLGLQVVHALSHIPVVAKGGRAQCHHVIPGDAWGMQSTNSQPKGRDMDLQSKEEELLG